MSEQFPRKVWKLTPGYQPKEITIVAEYRSWMFDGYEVDGATTAISKEDCWPTKEEAIAAGYARLDGQEAKLNKQRERIEKRRETLRAAASKLNKERK